MGSATAHYRHIIRNVQEPIEVSPPNYFIYYGPSSGFRRARELPPRDVRLVLDYSVEISDVVPQDIEETIKRHLKTKVFEKVEKSEEENEASCAICLCDFEDKEKIGVLSCGGRHEFHAKCIQKWLLQNNECPLCRGTALVIEDPRN